MLEKRDVDDVLVQGDYQSGDRYTVASALRLNPKLGVLILAHTNKQDAAIELKSMYDKAAGERRVEIAYLGRASDRAEQIKRVPQSEYSKVKKLINELIEAIYRKEVDKSWRESWRGRWPLCLRNGIEAGINLQIATYGTKVVAEQFGADPGRSRSTLRQHFKASNDKESALQKWLEGRGFKFGKTKAKYVLLWAKRGQQKAEKAHHFTSYVAQSRIAHEIRSNTDYTPVAAGDKLFLDTRPSLAQFWDDRSWKELFPTAGRTEQQHVYEFLARNCDVLSIGTRSGALELPALLGIRTLYLEEVANEQAERMERWIGKVPGFSRLIVDAPPGLFQKKYWTTQGRKSAAATAFAERIGKEIDAASKQGLSRKDDPRAVETREATWAMSEKKPTDEEKTRALEAKAIGAAEASVRAKAIGLNDDEMDALIEWVRDPNAKNVGRRRRPKNLKSDTAIGGSYNFYETIGEGTGKGKLLRGEHSKKYSQKAYFDKLKEKVAAREREKKEAATADKRFGKNWAGYYQFHGELDEFRLMDKDKRPISDKYIPLQKLDNWKLSGEDVLYVNRNGFYIYTDGVT
jgi:hypothetical protein